MSHITYAEWNTAVGRHCFHQGNAGRPIRFAIDPIVLQHAAAEGPNRYHFASPEAASLDFQEAVARSIDNSSASLKWWLGKTEAGRIPHGLAKLALQVLAVFQIRSDDEGSSSYWAALWELLGRDVTKRGVLPDDLNHETHQENWKRLVEWANDLNKESLGRLPDLDGQHTGRRHVHLPLSHGLLRSEDIKNLPRFFKRVGLIPGVEVDPDELERDLHRYAEDQRVFPGAHARKVLRDERLSLAAAQIAYAAAQWDGEFVDLAKARGSVVRLWLSPPARSSGDLRGGLVEINRDEYDPRIKLSDIFGRTELRKLDVPPYRPLKDSLVVAVRSLSGRYIESSRFRPGEEILVARPRRTDDRSLTEHLRRISSSGKVLTDLDPTGVLPTWSLFRLRIRENVTESELPGDLNGRLRRAGSRLTVKGGLRVRGDWMVGAGPTLSIQDHNEEKVIVDGEEYRLVEGQVNPGNCPPLDQDGLHEAWLPGRHRDCVRFRVTQPKPVPFKSSVVRAGWCWRAPPAWPEQMRERPEAPSGSMCGPAVEGDWPAVQPIEPPFGLSTRVTLRLVVAIRQPRSMSRTERRALRAANDSHPNLLVRQLARALPTTETDSRRAN